MPDQNNKEKKILIVGLVLIALVVIATFTRPLWSHKEITADIPLKETFSYPTISSQDLQQKIRDKEPLKIIDIRNADDYQKQHIIGSQNIPLAELDQSSIDASSETTIAILGYEDDAALSQQAGQILEKKNFKNVKVIVGGMQDTGNTISWGDPTSFTEQAKVNFITPEDLSSLLKNDASSLYIIDVRSAQLFAQEHLPQSRNIPLNELEKERKSIPISKTIIVYGKTELDAFQAGVGLYDLGFYTAKVLYGGFTQWKDKGLGTVK